MTDVIRGYHYDNILVVFGRAYSIDDLKDAVHDKLRAAGFGSGPKWAHPFHLPPFFRTGSPFGEQIKALADEYGIASSEPPQDMDFALVPHDGTYYRAELKKAWPTVFGCNFDLEYPNGEFVR